MSKNRAPSAGYTLVELIVYSSLMVLVLLIAGGLYITTLQLEGRMVDRAQAVSLSQVVTQSVHQSVRNATALNLTKTSDGQLLVAATTGTAAIAVNSCQAWFHTGTADGAFYYQRTQPAALVRAPSSEEVSAGLPGWILLGTGIEATVGDEVFALAGSTVSIDITIPVGQEEPPVLVTSRTTTLQNVEMTTEPTPCF